MCRFLRIYTRSTYIYNHPSHESLSQVINVAAHVSKSLQTIQYMDRAWRTSFDSQTNFITGCNLAGLLSVTPRTGYVYVRPW